MKYCGAKKKAKNGGGHCNAPAMANGRCRVHGGKSLSGIAHPNYKDGRFIRRRPTKIRERLEAALNDKEATRRALNENIGLLEVRIEELTLRLDERQFTSLELWQQAQRAYAKYKKAFAAGQFDTCAVAMRELEAALDAGIEDGELWEEITRYAERQARLVTQDHKLMVMAGKTITIEEYFLNLQKISDVIKRTVTDREALRTISATLRELEGV